MPYSPDPADASKLRFEDNRLLAMFPEAVKEALGPHAEYVHLNHGDVLFKSGEDIKHTYFPYAPTMISLLVDLDDRRRVEVASIGMEGAIGGIVSCGELPAFSRAQISVAGGALKASHEKIEELKAESPFLRNLYCRYADYLLSQVMQSVACSAFHPIEARAARWLLTAQDRAGSRLELTQEALAGLLGVQRTTVNAVARELQEDGLINYSRGVITLTDRDELEHRTCECYHRVEDHFKAVLGGQSFDWIDHCEKS
ncbi:Crp/Fnr family transcriptional regulator [Sphingomicrobium clamense]|uniref:Crp/Fnr family transcriptional regulator n=1 Tax=Sphingomicrobium clamense TaxID=2851013 RepID=A0ABS6V2B4_9SPHN|nr:Crp/Fnr family transcriptional regulator [Sphingomicrobium sp. B8]MBW0143700.1 Crp/Fnr family transcriptional regulator [Sphingomicrobium sp. B8]